MKRFILMIIAAFSFAAIGCDTVDKANDKIDQCLADDFGDELTSDIEDEWELSCEDGDDDCDECVDCVMDTECENLLDGGCSYECTPSLFVSPIVLEPQLPIMNGF